MCIYIYICKTTCHVTLFHLVLQDKGQIIVFLKAQQEFQQQQKQLLVVCMLSVVLPANQPPANYFPMFPALIFSVSRVKGPVSKICLDL